MKRIHLIIVLLLVSYFVYGQNKYDKISEFGQYNVDWALVESSGLLGFIDREGNEVIKPKYDKIINEKILKGEINGEVETIKNLGQ